MIYLIITASLRTQYGHPIEVEKREAQYIHAIRETLSHVPCSIQPIIVENNGTRTHSTCLDGFIHEQRPVPVIYTSNNKSAYKNKGVNEWMDVLDALNQCGASNNDVFIKITGRYRMADSSFLECVLAEQEHYDAWFKFYNVSTRTYHPFDCVLGMFAMRVMYARMYSPLNMGLYASPEIAMAKYVHRSIPHVHEIEQLGLNCQFADDRTEQWHCV